ncbi:MAG TPA: YceI family protein [Thauera sp.]|jgi:polyisoprenoid-binding protein YceI|nr:YceI family protein [Thauera sp.]HRA80087.1 YceI family protein [Thauera sp.]
MKRIVPALLFTLVCAATAQAVEYNQIQPDKSRIGFGYQQMGVTMDGSFSKFASQLSFDPAALASARVSIEIDLASIDTGLEEGDDEVVRKTWLNTRDFPTARFESTSVKALGGDRYAVTGKLTIKGTTREVIVPATFAAQGGLGVFNGSLTIQRGDFALGEGAWKAFDIVANDVVIKFRITAATN